ncbi:MAG: DUF6054 family protein [Oscillospiraceae bacterium]|jgi:hypothetical protein|nr:DUF6054 family protein [Oscillospiraceae bacterium]
MAKYECRLQGDFKELLGRVDHGIQKGSISASLEGGSDYSGNGIRCAVRVYERYSWFGGNRVSMNVTLIGKDDELFISVITSGGSQAVFFKINTFGEERFLQCAVDIIESYHMSKRS